jgi:hypothetical protein
MSRYISMYTLLAHRIAKQMTDVSSSSTATAGNSSGTAAAAAAATNDSEHSDTAGAPDVYMRGNKVCTSTIRYAQLLLMLSYGNYYMLALTCLRMVDVPYYA